MDRLRPDHRASALVPLLRRLSRIGAPGGADDWERDVLDDESSPLTPGLCPANRLSDRLAVVCVGTGCAGVLAIIVIEFMHPTAIGLTAIGAIAAAAFRAGSAHGVRSGGKR